MNISFSSAVPAQTDLLIVPVAKDAGNAGETIASWLPGAAKAARFDGETATVMETFVPGDSDTGVRRVALVGIGEGKDRDLERAGAAIVAKYQTAGAASVAIDFSMAPTVNANGIAHFALGMTLRNWRLDRYRTTLEDKQKPTLVDAVIVTDKDAATASWDALRPLADGIALTRTIVTEPGNILYPESFVDYCRSAMEPLGVEITVLDEAEIRALGMGALIGVAQGSVRPPRILALKWNGKGDDSQPVVFVGKGITFDTGGISLKPGAGMEDMKFDCGGAAAVAGALMTLAGRKARANVVGVCVLAENMPDAGAQRPGDVVTTMSGQTVEVINTDAEGRLVLGDAMTWAQRTFKPEVMIDMATLTGAMIISLGYEHAGFFCNDDALADRISAAGKASHDSVWRMPLGAAYDKLIESPIADMRNIGPREAGSITAAQYLQRFVEDGVKWAHIDMAGPVWAQKPGATWDKGATGYGVRLFDRIIADSFEG